VVDAQGFQRRVRVDVRREVEDDVDGGGRLSGDRSYSDGATVGP